MSEGLLCQFPAMTGLILTRHLSDHKPILLKEPIPFKMFLSWFDIEGFDQMVKDAWQNEVVVDLNEMSYLKKKFQMLKKKINSWVQQNRVKANDKRKEIQEKLHNLDKQKEQDGGQEYLLNPRKGLWKDLRVLDELTKKDLVQKAKKKSKAMIFKVDFEKAYDSVRWDFLDMILHRFGFGDTWREWKKGCLVSSSALILVNESPTQEFDFEQGLRQGDTLSSFLFLLVMEALHISFVRAMDGGFFKGETNVEVNRGAQMIGCEASKTPFKYLGIMVGGKMNRIHSWDVVIDKVIGRLSKWKVKTPFIGGRFTLTKSVQFFRGVEPGTRKVAWFSWDSVVASKDVGCLGVSTFFAMNCALLFKWIWRFKVQPEAMWVSVIKAIHGRLGNLDRGVKMDHDKWVWNLEGDGVFKVSSARRFIDEGLCDMEGTHTRWIKLVPIKVNVFAWRLASNKLPTRFNMSSRGLEIPSIVCPGGGGFWIVVSRPIKGGLLGSKSTKRAGWVKRDVAGPESIADHMYRMGLRLSFLLIDLESTETNGVTKAEKSRMEKEALDHMCKLLGGGPRAEEIHALWMEYEENSTPEAKVVKDFDKVIHHCDLSTVLTDLGFFFKDALLLLQASVKENVRHKPIYHDSDSQNLEVASRFQGVLR
ncbi:RNA-directed DNA polymerase, eukaryota [Tanacetum coccineum]